MEPRGCVSDVSLSMKKRDTVHMLGWRDASSAEFEYTRGPLSRRIPYKTSNDRPRRGLEEVIFLLE